MSPESGKAGTPGGTPGLRNLALFERVLLIEYLRTTGKHPPGLMPEAVYAMILGVPIETATLAMQRCDAECKNSWKRSLMERSGTASP